MSKGKGFRNRGAKQSQHRTVKRKLAAQPVLTGTYAQQEPGDSIKLRTYATYTQVLASVSGETAERAQR